MGSEQEIISGWKKGAFHPVYWLEGDEPYDIDKIVEYAENHILSKDEASFNLSVFYGRDSKAEEIINACKRYPMFAERQVVLLKEAQHMRDIEKLEYYFEKPLISTIFIVAYKEKKLDGRSKFSKLVKSKSVYLSTKKLYDNELPEWVSTLAHNKGYELQSKALRMIVDHIGNDLQRIENELEKITVNLAGRNQITEDDIENFIGVSKEFNIFELQAALVNRDLAASVHILNYFDANPKAAPIQLILPTLYSFFSKLYVAYSSGSRDEHGIALALGIKGFFAKQYIRAMQNYSYAETEKILLLLHDTNLKSIGVHRADSDDVSLLKEMVSKIVLK
jgi:DNA polymerase-3 subunit delta